jgi:hypothetical protein
MEHHVLTSTGLHANGKQPANAVAGPRQLQGIEVERGWFSMSGALTREQSSRTKWIADRGVYHSMNGPPSLHYLTSARQSLAGEAEESRIPGQL